MSKEDAYELLFRDPEYIVLKASHCFEKLCNFLDYGAAHYPLEAYSYAASSWILTLYSAVCQPVDPSGSIGAHPQLLFEDIDPFKHSFRAHKRRSPDLGAVISHLQEVKNDSPLYKGPFLLFWWEIKALRKNTPWLSHSGDVTVRFAMVTHLLQVTEQARFAMKHYAHQQVFYGFLVIGGSFSLWRFTRPSSHAATGKRQRTPSADGLNLSSEMMTETIHHCQLIVHPNRKGFTPQFLYAMALVKGEHDIIQQPFLFDAVPGDHSANFLSLVEAAEDIEKAKTKAHQAAAEEALSSHDSDAKPPRARQKKRKMKHDERSYRSTIPHHYREASPRRTRSHSSLALSAEEGVPPNDEADDADDDDGDGDDDDDDDNNGDDGDDNGDTDDNGRYDDYDDDMGVGRMSVPIISDDEDNATSFLPSGDSSRGRSPYHILLGSEYDSEYGLDMQNALLHAAPEASSSGASQFDVPLDSEYASDDELDEESEDASPDPPSTTLPSGPS